MPTTLFVRQQHLGSGPQDDDYDDHASHYHSSDLCSNSKDYLQHKTALYIISEHEYVRSLSSPAPQREARNTTATASSTTTKTPPTRVPPRRSHSPFSQHSTLKKKAPRPLMATLSYNDASNMALGGPPGSPPDLTNSKSSKSSSVRSSTLSDIMGPTDLSHFEEINLDDLQGALGPSTFPMPISPSNRVLFEASNSRSSVSSSRSLPQGHSTHSFRDLTSGSKPRYPSLKGQVNGVNRQQPSGSSLAAPGRSMRRGFTSPSAPSLASLSSGRKSRSPSPSNPQAFPSAPRTLSRRSSRNLEISPSSTANPRRQSWQHGSRKTIKELEAECDDDGDDDLPDDTYLWGVPMSPRPTQERSQPTSANNSPPRSSHSPAGSRPSSQHSYASSKLSQLSQGPSPKPFSQPPSPNSANDENAENIPPQPLTRQRTNTWEDTYNALDEDGKKLTEALEEYETELERQQEVQRQKPGVPRPASVDSKSSSKTAATLPPVRKSDPLVDPFQPSAEKQKYLSRTRPSWLPPKDPKEEKKHLKEYQKMHERIEQAERLAAQKEEEEKLAKETAERKKAEVWENLLPKWETETATRDGKAQYRKLWWNGIPPKYRGVVWQKAIGNELGISETTFKVALEKANSHIKELGDRAFEGRVVAILENTKDVFPDLKMFAPASSTAEEQPYHKDLVNVCLAYMSYRPDVDTLAGVHHIAGLFLLNMSPADSFICLGNLLNRPLPLSFLLNDHNAIMAAYDATLSALYKKAPSLARHLAELRVEPHNYLYPMFSSLFCDRLSIEHAARVMDLYSIEGDKIPPRVAVAILGILEVRLYQGGAEAVVRNLNTKDINLPADDFSGKVYEAGKSA